MLVYFGVSMLLCLLDYGMHLFKANQNGTPKFNPLTAMTNDNVEDGISSSTLAYAISVV